MNDYPTSYENIMNKFTEQYNVLWGQINELKVKILQKDEEIENLKSENILQKKSEIEVYYDENRHSLVMRGSLKE